MAEITQADRDYLAGVMDEYNLNMWAQAVRTGQHGAGIHSALAAVSAQRAENERLKSASSILADYVRSQASDSRFKSARMAIEKYDAALQGQSS